MSTHADKIQENKSQSVASKTSPVVSGAESNFQFVDNRSEAVSQQKLQDMANNSNKQLHAAQLRANADNYFTQQHRTTKKNENGMLFDVVQRVDSDSDWEMPEDEGPDGYMKPSVNRPGIVGGSYS